MAYTIRSMSAGQWQRLADGKGRMGGAHTLPLGQIVVAWAAEIDRPTGDHGRETRYKVWVGGDSIEERVLSGNSQNLDRTDVP